MTDNNPSTPTGGGMSESSGGSRKSAIADVVDAIRGESVEWVGDLAPGARASERPQRHNWLLRRLSSTAFLVTLVDVVLVLVFTALSPGHVFFSIGNFQNLALSASEILLLALAEVYLLGAGELDISLGAVLILSSVVAAKVMLAVAGQLSQAGSYPHPALAIAAGAGAGIGTGAAVGLMNGLIVTKVKVNSLIATLATLGAATALADLITNGGDISGVPIQIQSGFGASEPADIPLPVVLVAVVAFLAWIALTRTRFGLHTLALGSSRETARRAGLEIDRHVILLFVAAGVLAAIAGLIDLSRFATTNIGGHQTDAIAAIAGAVIGGTALAGGRASVAGAVAGTLFSVILEVGLVVLNVSAYYQPMATGAILVLAVGIDQRQRVRQLTKRKE
jgi:ribose transport system permease protein